MHQLRFRQIHLDFHTSPDIDGIGTRFDKKTYQRVLQDAAVDSVTTFAKCHHGWSYHPTKVGKMHPHLSYDLLRAQYDACKEIDINVPIYISAGVDDMAGQEHPEWRPLDTDGKLSGWGNAPLAPGFAAMDFHSPYLDYLVEQTLEVVQLFPDCDGIFLDIILQWGQGSKWAIDYMLKNGLDPENEADREVSKQAALRKYYERITEACQSVRSDMPVFHNSGHMTRGRRDILPFFSHLELESLPTGGWGYDHFPLSAAYARKLDTDFLGMTGKFHTTWGEFGGYKHPNALRYECAAMVAMGSKCSVGDQLHPTGEIDESTYRVIGAAYREVRDKEPWAQGATSAADVAVLSDEAVTEARSEHGPRNNPADTGVSRILLEGHYPFDLLDTEMSFDGYKLLILPDAVRVDDKLQKRIDDFVKNGGKLLLTGESGLKADNSGFAFDIGASWEGQSEFNLDFALPIEADRAELIDSPMVMYGHSQRIKTGSGQSLGQVFDPYFNRTWKHFCSHQHAPARPDASGYNLGVSNGSITYLAHPVFSIYAKFGAVPMQQWLLSVIGRILEGDKSVSVEGLPSTGRVSLMRQEAEGRHVLHLLYANTVSRGGTGRGAIQIIQELMPLENVRVTVKLPGVSKATLAPQGKALAVEQVDGGVRFTIDRFECHQMIELA